MSRGQEVLAALVGLGTLYPLYVGLRLVGADLGSSGEKFDGLGTALGVAVLGPVLLAGLAVAFWWWRGRGQRRGWVALGLAAVLVGAELWWAALMGFA